jgi:flagellar FliJ protein
MKKFQFRLETLLRLREAVRDERRSQLADAFRVLETLAEQDSKLTREMNELRSTVRSRTGAIDVDHLLNSQRYEMVLQLERQKLQQQQLTVNAEIEKRREALVAADQEVRSLEKLRESQSLRHRAEIEQREMKEMDEVAARTYTRGSLG